MDQNILAAAMRCAGLNIYEARGYNPKDCAQFNLSGRTHYVDPDTLRFHKARITSAQPISMGSFFLIVESCAVDYHNTRRTFRAVCFDIFGTVIYRPDLDSGSTSTQAASDAFYKFWNQFNQAAYYQEKLKDKTRRAQEAEIVFNQTLKAAA
jgi:hypothetical protein